MTVDRRPGIAVIDVAGELDLNGAPALCAAIEEVRSPRDRDRVIVDLSRVGFCDSTGLRALVNAAREVAIAGGRLVVIVPEEGPVRQVIRLTGAQEFLDVSADRERVVAARRTAGS